MTQYYSNMQDFSLLESYQRNQQIAEMEKHMGLWRAMEADAAWRRAEQLKPPFVASPTVCELFQKTSHRTHRCFIFRPDLALAHHGCQLPHDFNPGVDERTR